MEEDSREILSPLLEKPYIQKQFEEISRVVDEAQKRIDYNVAHDPDILKAIDTVERFLRKNKRVCYGGQAINALLPKQLKFYDTEYVIPDYDFFTPSPDSDAEELIDMLEKEGFNEVNKKVAIHEGTMKILVNFTPVADISKLHPKLFKILQKRAKIVSGIYYSDPDFLRMMMYLELSRPRGQVERWKKVYERLTLLNSIYPVNKCEQNITVPTIHLEDRALILDFCVKHKRVVVAPEFIEIFQTGTTKKHMRTLVERGGPVIFFSDKAKIDAEDLSAMFSGKPAKIHEVKTMTDELFDFVTVKRGGHLALIFQENACHSYTTLKLDEGNELRIATPDLYLHLYYSLMLFGAKEKEFFDTSLECLIQKLNGILKISRNKAIGIVPTFGLRCSGRQKGYATLLREKKNRTNRAKMPTKRGQGMTKRLRH